MKIFPNKVLQMFLPTVRAPGVNSCRGPCIQKKFPRRIKLLLAVHVSARFNEVICVIDSRHLTATQGHLRVS